MDIQAQAFLPKFPVPEDFPVPDLVADGSYREVRKLPDGRWIGIHRLMFHWTLHVDISEMGYEDRYCLNTYEQAKEMLDNWDGTLKPNAFGWHRHPNSGIRRNPETGETWYAP